MADQDKLLEKFKELRSRFDSCVPSAMSEAGFWELFLKKNHEKNSELFGGRNPIFIPGHTDECVYDQTFLQN